MTRNSMMGFLALGMLSATIAPNGVALAQGGGRGGAAARPMINQPDNSLLRGFRWRSIGPVGQGVRVDDFAVDEKNPSTYYIGFAVSGILKTVNNGTTFESIFDTYGSASIADLALAPSDPNILYVATGEANNRQTTSYGDGLYKSTDAGKTFTKVGFDNHQTLGRVVVHPKDPNTVWVAVGGDLYGENAERGVYMTTDGGKSWKQTLFVDNRTSATEIIVDPVNPLNLWAAMYQRFRTSWGFNGGGAGSGIYNSTDGGKTWKKMSGNGLPSGMMGRVALDIMKTNPNVIYAQIEVADPNPPAAVTPPAGGRGGADTTAGGRGAGGGRGAAGAGAAGGRAGAGAAGGRGNAAPAAPPNPQTSGVWRSLDHGKTWKVMSNANDRPMYFSQIRVDPNNQDVVYLGGVNPTKSINGGATWLPLTGMGHVDNHAIWIDPLNSNHVMYGNDGGVDVSYDAGENWEALRNHVGGLAYHISADFGYPYRVCTGLQDNGSWCGPSSTRSGGIHMWNWISVGSGDGFQSQIDPVFPNIFYTESQNAGIQRYNLATGEAVSIKPNAGGGRGGGGGGGGGGGDLTPEQIAALQDAQAAGGRGGRGSIVPPPPAGTVMQHNWNSPIRLSHHNASTIYLGGRQLFISRNRGDTWTMTKDMGKGIDISTRSIMGVSYALPGCGGRGGGGGGRGAAPAPVIPAGSQYCILSKVDGYVANEYGTMTEMAESPVIPGILWAGTDDGNVQVSRDGGLTFTEVGKNIPVANHETYISGIEASWFDAATAYVALDGHRDNDLKPYIFKTTDYGATWKSVTGDFPNRNVVNSIRQDPVNRNLLYAPTELGFYVSLNDGVNWTKFMPNLPTGRTDDVLVHPRDHDLILATHSRSVWIMDDITALQALTTSGQARDVVLFAPRDAILWKADRMNVTELPGNKIWAGEVAPRGTAIAYYLKNVPTGDVKVTITNTATGAVVQTCTGAKLQGLNRFQWGLTAGGAGGAAGGGQGGRGGGGRGGAAGADTTTAAAPAGPAPCAGGAGGGGGRGGGGGGGGVPAGVYRVTLTVSGVDMGTQTFSVLEDIWLNQR